MTKKKIKLFFTDFWPNFNPHENYFCRLLSNKYEIELTENPDFLIYSCYNTNYRKFKCIRIFYTAENKRPNFNECDFSFSFDYIDNYKNYRLPYYCLYDNELDTIIHTQNKIEEILKSKTKFCNFIYSNPYCKERNEFFHLLSEYKKVDSGGKVFNNLGYFVDNKSDFIKNYKFTIAFENSSYPGYTTEKVFEPMIENSIPIYWGNPLINKDFNTKSFINCHEYNSFEDVVQRIIEIDNNDDLYFQYLKEPYYNNNQMNDFVKPDNVLKQFDYIFSMKNKMIPVAIKNAIKNIPNKLIYRLKKIF